MKYYIPLLIALMIMAIGCSSDVSKDASKETAKDVVKEVDKGISDTTQNVADAIPYLQEDLSEGFWSAIDTIGEVLNVETGKNLPVPGDENIARMHAKVDAAVQKSVVDTANRLQKTQAGDTIEALALLGQVLASEIEQAEKTPATSPASGAEDPAIAQQLPIPKKMPSPEEVKAAWETLSKFADKPASVRKIFESIINYVKAHPEYNAQAGMVGPADKASVGPKALEFLTPMAIGEISKPVKFKEGYLIVQMIDNANDKFEVGYIYIKPVITTTDGATTIPATEVSSDANSATPPGTDSGK